MSGFHSVRGRALRAALALAVAAGSFYALTPSTSASARSAAGVAAASFDPCVARGTGSSSKLPDGYPCPQVTTTTTPGWGTTPTTTPTSPCVDTPVDPYGKIKCPVSPTPTTTPGEPVVPSTPASPDGVHLFVMGDSWSVRSAAPGSAEAVAGLAHNAAVPIEGPADPTGDQAGHAAQFLADVGRPIETIHNYSLGGAAAGAWLNEDGPCVADTAQFLYPGGITNGCYDNGKFDGTVPANAPDAYRLDEVLAELGAVPADDVPVVYLSLGAADVLFARPQLRPTKPAQRSTRLDATEQTLRDLTDALLGAHDRTEIVIPGYATWNNPTGMFDALQWGFLDVDLSVCGNFTNKKEKVLNSLLTGQGNGGCFDDRGLHGVYESLDASDPRITYSTSVPRGGDFEDSNWLLFNTEAQIAATSAANQIDAMPPTPACALTPDGFHLSDDVPAGCDWRPDRATNNAAAQFGYEAICDWYLLREEEVFG